MKRIFTLALALGFVIGVQKVYAQQEGKELLGKWGKILNSRNFEVKFHSYEEFDEKGVPLHFIGENMAENIIAHDGHGPVLELRNGVKTYYAYDSDGNETYRSVSLGHERRA